MFLRLRHLWKVFTGRKLVKTWGQSSFGMSGVIGVLTYSDGSEIVLGRYPPAWADRIANANH